MLLIDVFLVYSIVHHVIVFYIIRWAGIIIMSVFDLGVADCCLCRCYHHYPFVVVAFGASPVMCIHVRLTANLEKLRRRSKPMLNINSSHDAES